MTPRHFRRLLRRFAAEGDGVVIHGICGRSSNQALPPAVCEAVLGQLAQWDSSVHPWLEDRVRTTWC